MPTLRAVLFATLAACALGPAVARAQHSPTIADASEIGAELRLADEVTTFAGIYQTPIGSATDARAGFGIASVDDADSEVFLTGGLRYLLSRGSARFPLDVALDGELNLFLLDDTVVQIVGGPSFGGAVGAAGVLVPYVQPLLSVAFNGDSESDLGVRLGADYGLTPTVSLRGDLVLGDVAFGGDPGLRAAIYFEF
ncbi:MAG: hypothetical protein ABR599_05700 [Gemmatimonadota bacterium]